jgi:hypothetical protein
MKYFVSLCALIVLFSVSGCEIIDSGSNSGSSQGGGQQQSSDDLHVSSITGVVVQITPQPNDIFWGILAEDGRKFEVLNMPMDLRTDGLRVRFEGDIRFVATRSSGYGTTLSVSKIEKI